MRKPALVLVTAATLAMAAVASPSPAHARYYGHGAGIVGGLVAGALIAGIASSAYGYGPGFGYGGYYPAYYGGYYPAYYGGYYPGYVGGYVYRRSYYGYRHVYAPSYAYYGGPRYYGGWHRGWRHWYVVFWQLCTREDVVQLWVLLPFEGDQCGPRSRAITSSKHFTERRSPGHPAPV